VLLKPALIWGVVQGWAFHWLSPEEVRWFVEPVPWQFALAARWQLAQVVEERLACR